MGAILAVIKPLERRMDIMRIIRDSGPVDKYLTRSLSGNVFTWREIFDLMIPGVLDSLSIMFINTLITALISKNGETSVAAVSLMGPVTAVVVNIFNGISAGGTVVVAQCSGRKDASETRAAIGITMWLTILIGTVICLPFLIAPHGVVHLLYPLAEAEVAEKAQTFLWGVSWSILIFTVYTAAFAVLRGLGYSKRCLILSIIINVAYFLFSILFLNFMNLDIKGSVYALFLARLIGTVFAIALLFFWRPPEKMKLKEVFSFDRRLIASTLKVGVPLSIEQMFIAFANIVSGMFMTLLGTTAIATNAIANSLLGLLFAPAMSINGLTVTVVGRCIGAQELDEAKRYGRSCCKISRALLVLFSLIFYPCLPLLLQQYNPSPESARMVPLLLYATIPFLIYFWPIGYTMPNTLRAANDTMFPSVLSLLVLWVINIALGYVLAIPAGLGLWGVWIATWLGWMVRASGFGMRFRSGKWIANTLKQ